MGDLNKLLGSITLVQLLEILQEMGILVSSPYDLDATALAPSSAQATAPSAPSPPAEPLPEPAPTPMPARAAPAPAPPRPNEAVFAGLLLALSQLGINNADANHSASLSSVPPAGAASSSLASGSQGPTAAANFESRGVAVSVAPAPVPAVSPSARVADKGKGKETAVFPKGETHSGFVCANCKMRNLRSSKDSWYVVTASREVGVFRGWHNVLPLVSGVSGACHQKHPSEDAARMAFAEALAAGNVVQL